jgi:hypothetical protein
MDVGRKTFPCVTLPICVSVAPCLLVAGWDVSEPVAPDAAYTRKP